MKLFLCLAGFLFISVGAIAQMPAAAMAGRMGGARQGMNAGHFYGKVVNSKTGKGISAVTIQLTGNKFDTVTKQMKTAILKTILSEKNGDFSLDNLPVFGNFKLTISRVSYKPVTQQISFGLKFTPGGAQNQDMQQIISMIDKDLGNIKMEEDVTQLGDVVITATKPAFEMGVDRKIFNVDKNIVSTGQTATELMKSIPSLSVDIDGNVTLRNAAPTIFVDGRPTTLTLDQIPSDIIDRVEIITNPSAKFDASGGTAGILNIVLKKNKKNGYNGGVRAGVDSRGKMNLGGDINFRQNKVNFFGSANYNQRKSEPYNRTFKSITSGSDTTNSYSHDSATNNGYFGFFRAGMDYFLDNRNTITIAGSYTRGHFENNDPQFIDSTVKGSTFTSNKYTLNNMDFHNAGAQISFKHNFAKNGHDLNFDFNYNSSSPNSTSYIQYPAYLQSSTGSGYNHYFTLQTDYENQLSENSKFEAGARAAIRDFRSDNDQFIDTIHVAAISSHYSFTDRVYAAYATYSLKVKKWNYQLGLRAESSNYNGMLDGNDSSKIKVDYPISFFPSVFITYKINNKQDFQINYSRRVNRPNFFQLLPIYNFSDPQNPTVGNSNLSPEFTNSFELSYANTYTKGSNLLISAYFKGTNNLITQYAYKDINKSIPGATDSLYYISYINANSSIAYGLEVTNKSQLLPWWEITGNINLFDSKLSATIPGQNVDNSLMSWFGKLNTNFKIAKGLTLQITGEWTSKILVPKSGGGGGMGGGRGGPFGGTQNLAQGYIEPRYWDFDVAIKKEWTWKSGESFSINLSSNDIFRTHTKTYTQFTGFLQTTDRMRDPQLVRLNLTYRFGKIDVSLFKRKNTKADQSGGGMDMMQ